MKRWWNTPRDFAWARKTVRRARPILTGAVIASAVSFPIPGQLATTHCSGGMCDKPSIARTSGAVVALWAFGTLSGAQQPSSAVCDLANVCDLVISSNGGAGTGAGATIKNDLATSTQTDPSPNLPFTLTETIDYRHPVIKERITDGQGACYPANGVMTITPDASSTLVLDIVGQACQVTPISDQLIFTGAYFSDATSTGQFANVDGIGSVNINSPSGLQSTAQNMKASFLGQLKYTP